MGCILSKYEDGDSFPYQDINKKKEESLPIEVVESSPSNEDIINNTWLEIDQSIAQLKPLDYSQTPGEVKKKNGWKVIRLFISSTFADFHEEREVLVKKVVPELREWCEKRQVHLIECDLRWGVPKNTDSQDTISTCLDEVSRCIKETDGKPFFLNMLSERYGWIPKKSDLSDELVSLYNWIFPLSITHMEILCAALRTNSPNALFMIRDEESLAGMPESFLSSFIDTPELSKLSLQRLKQELKKRFPDKTFSYRSKISGVDSSTGLEKLHFEELDEFASVITRYYKERIEEYAPLVEELADHSMFQQDVFIQKKGSLLVGRKNEIRNILQFLKSEKKCMLVIAEQGNGKSSLIAATVLELSQENVPCLYNFSSSTPGSTESLQVMLHFIHQLSTLLNKPFPKDIEGYENILKAFHNLLREMCSKQNGFTIVLDAVNQFEDEAGLSCSWLPKPSEDLDIHYIISCTPEFGDGYNSIKQKFENLNETMYLTGFTTEHQVELVHLLFSRYNKKLDPEQLSLLVSCDGASSPLWLALACEELRVFGVFEKVTERIKELPSSIEGLISFIFKRIIAEDETTKVEKTLCLLACSAHNLAEMELLHLLVDENGQPLPMSLWIKIRRQIKSFLLNTGSEECEFYSFFHSSAKKVIFQTLLCDESNVKGHHKELGEFFLTHGTNDYRTASSIVFHFKKAQMNEEIIGFLRKDGRSSHITDVERSRIFSDIRCTNFINPGNNPFKFPVRCCNICCSRTKILSQNPLPTKNICIVCGGFCPWKNNESQAFLCQQHKQLAAPDTDKCYLCGRVIFLKQSPGVALFEICYCCSMCSVKKRCIALSRK